MNRNFLKKTAVMFMASTMLMATACNNKIKVSYDYNVNDYVELGDYKNIEVVVDRTSIENTHIEEKIKSDIAEKATYTEVSRGAVNGDQIVVSYSTTIGGTPAESFTNTSGLTMVLGKDEFPLDFGDVEKELYDMVSGQTKILTVVIPETYDSAVYAGSKAVVELTMKTVAQVNTPMITDAYIKETFGYNTVAEYREHAKEEIKANLESAIEEAKHEAVLTKLQDICKVSAVPDSVYDEVKESLDKSIGFYADYTKMTVDEYCQSLWNMSYKEYIEKYAKQQLIMEAIIKKEDMSIREYDYKGDLEDFAKANGRSNKDAFEKEFGKEEIVKAMLLQKAQDFVMDHAEITYK